MVDKLLAAGSAPVVNVVSRSRHFYQICPVVALQLNRVKAGTWRESRSNKHEIVDGRLNELSKTTTYTRGWIFIRVVPPTLRRWLPETVLGWSILCSPPRGRFWGRQGHCRGEMKAWIIA